MGTGSNTEIVGKTAADILAEKCAKVGDSNDLLPAIEKLVQNGGNLELKNEETGKSAVDIYPQLVELTKPGYQFVDITSALVKKTSPLVSRREAPTKLTATSLATFLAVC